MLSRILLSCLLVLTSKAWCAEVSASLGLASSHDGRTARIGEISATYPISEDNGRLKRLGIHQIEVLAGWIESRSRPGLNDSTRFVGIGVRRRAGRWFGGAGLALIDNQTEALSSPYQFVTSAGMVFDSFTITLRHFSNAGLRGPNRGETYLALGYVW